MSFLLLFRYSEDLPPFLCTFMRVLLKITLNRFLINPFSTSNSMKDECNWVKLAELLYYSEMYILFKPFFKIIVVCPHLT